MYRSQNPDAFTNAYVTNAEELRTNKHFKNFATKHMRVYKEAKKMSFETRYRSLWFMSVFGDVAVSHQLDSIGSYLALELLYGNWPLVHNNPSLKVRRGSRRRGGGGDHNSSLSRGRETNATAYLARISPLFSGLRVLL